jgi:2-polyprenyl-6-methoxyphenol hydroxylase-like FAD-dependent oxidoreductase
MSTHGMTAALRDAELLARAVVSAAPRTRDLHIALDGYQAERDRLSTPMIRATDEIAGYAWDLGRVRALLRTMSSAMTDEVEALGSFAVVP